MILTIIITELFAVYEKQLFYEKMIAACYVNPQVLRNCQELMHTNAIEIPRFKDIWSDKTKLHFASTMDSGRWISSERLQTMEERTRNDETARRPGRMWQDFEVILQFPEPVHCPEQYWFKIDEYSVPNLIDAGKNGKVFFCPRCERQKAETVFCRAQTEFAPSASFPGQCIGCAFKSAHYSTLYKVQNYGELRAK